MRCCPDQIRGFTLIEVMAAGVILSVLVLGLTQVWAAVAERSIDTTVRQKAVFVLNGEMERLSALYNLTAFGDSVALDTNGYGAPAGFADDRAVYRTAANAFMPTGADAFVTDSVATFEAGPDALVLLDDNSPDSTDRAYVWIDRQRGILGRVSWSELDIPAGKPKGATAGGSGLCFDFAGGVDGANCREITLYLDYPFRLVGGTPTSSDDVVRILPLKTIVGRWR
ncbi:type IV pilus modification PilV family protein [Minwuia sp.]|uniref:type IV pilus modification PilV family protein n=1 Tax=Minwuia sp. TaxID=2493630 RepID=UPI003A93FDB8